MPGGQLEPIFKGLKSPTCLTEKLRNEGQVVDKCVICDCLMCSSVVFIINSLQWGGSRTGGWPPATAKTWWKDRRENIELDHEKSTSIAFTTRKRKFCEGYSPHGSSWFWCPLRIYDKFTAATKHRQQDQFDHVPQKSMLVNSQSVKTASLNLTDSVLTATREVFLKKDLS